MAFAAARPSASAPSDGARTLTLRDDQPREESTSGDETVGALRLRGGPRTTRRNTQRVVWRDDVVDNEGAGKKSSKICCIYHRPKAFDESSSEESSDSDSDSECGHNHTHGHSHRPNTSSNGEGSSNVRNTNIGSVVREEIGDTNAYERQPGRSSKKGKIPARNEA